MSRSVERAFVVMSKFCSECYFFEMCYASPYIAKSNMFALQLVKYLYTSQNIVCLEYIAGIYTGKSQTTRWC